MFVDRVVVFFLWGHVYGVGEHLGLQKITRPKPHWWNWLVIKISFKMEPTHPSSIS